MLIFRIRIVANCRFHSGFFTRNLKWDTTLEFTNEMAINFTPALVVFYDFKYVANQFGKILKYIIFN